MAADQKFEAGSPSPGVKEESGRHPPALLSFPEIFQAHAGRVFRALVCLGVRSSDAEDACQEVMLVVHRRLPEFDGRAVESWLWSICLRVASDYRRSARVRREISVDAVPDAPLPGCHEQTADGRRLEARLLAVLSELDDDKRAAFVLYEIQELSIREIAEATGCPVQTIYSRLQAARAHVRDAFSENGTKGAQR